MSVNRNILQITPSGARLLDANGRRVQLALPLGTSVVLEFDLRGMPNTFDGTLSTLPIDEYGATEFYFAVDEKPESSDVPALLRITGITIETDRNGRKIFRVEIPNTASPEIVSRLGDRDKAEFWAEIGGINADGVAAFAWSFNIAVLNRVYGGGGEETAANDPAYLKAVEVKAMLPTLTVEQTEAGAIITTTDKNGSQSAEIKGIPGEKGDKGDPGEKSDYSAFEVYAHAENIPAGKLTQPHLSYIGQEGDSISQAVPASMTHSFIVRSEVAQDRQDVVIDWGDGTVTPLFDIVPAILTGEYRYTVEHTYAKNGTYIVKIIGRDYFSFIYGGDETKNLLCRIFDTDLPIAPWIWNLSGMCRQAQRLLRVNFYSHPVGIQAVNWSNTFLGSRNLLTVYGFTQYNNRYTACTQIFTNARALIDTDFVLCPYPRTLTSNAGCFIKCGKLAVDINKLIPVNGFKSGSTIDLTQVLWGCSSITGTVPADLLWNDKTIRWVNTSQAFADCSAEIRAQVPVSWGGTADDSIIAPSLEDRIKALEARCAALGV